MRYIWVYKNRYYIEKNSLAFASYFGFNICPGKEISEFIVGNFRKRTSKKLIPIRLHARKRKNIISLIRRIF